VVPKARKRKFVERSEQVSEHTKDPLVFPPCAHEAAGDAHLQQMRDQLAGLPILRTQVAESTPQVDRQARGNKGGVQLADRAWKSGRG
jgi:hypothetical protein